MTPGSDLAKALQAVDWPNNVAIFVNSRSLLRRLALCNYRIAVWAKQLVSIDAKNPAVSFVHEMQQAGFYAAALAGLALYKPAAAAIRTAVETGLYYTYFRIHPAELATLARSTGYFMSRKDLLEYHKIHSRGFAHAKLFNQPSRFVAWYSNVSAVVHGQLPGKWSQLTALAAATPNLAVAREVVSAFEEGTANLNDLLLLTVGYDLWARLTPQVKPFLLNGASPKQRRGLRMDRL